VITSLEDKEVFVFGANMAGAHAGGAALQAFEQFGAEWGVGEGLTGHCYAFPTLNEKMERHGDGELHCIKHAFYRCVNAHPELTFLLTKVGCGIAGYDENIMRKLFSDAPKNVIKPAGW
jgi:hypothetical protein